jgi:hypothetical protein
MIHDPVFAVLWHLRTAVPLLRCQICDMLLLTLPGPRAEKAYEGPIDG